MSYITLKTLITLFHINSTGQPEEFQGLMEDKDIASRAVAFVVSSTRKGFVALCADVASLIGSKRRFSIVLFVFEYNFLFIMYYVKIN